MTKLGLYLVTWICACSSLTTAMPDLHHQMSPEQLKEIFHVDDKHLVPNYEIVKLVHHTPHSINKRSINSNNLFSNSKNNVDLSVNLSNSSATADSDSAKRNKKNNHHVKKDLSKIPYYEKSVNDEKLGNSFFKPQPQLKVEQVAESVQHNVSFSAFGELLNLTLSPTEGLFKNGPNALKMWNVRTDPNATQGLVYEKVDEHHEDIGDIFQDQENMAAILVRKHEESGDLMMEGSIGHELVIRPLPTSLTKTSEGVHHVVFKRSSTEDSHDDLSDFAYMEPDRMQRRYRRAADGSYASPPLSRSKRAIPHIIYPEILVIVDYDGYRLHGGDNIQIKRYFVSFWNGVDLRYRLLKGPRIRISIAGIIISRGRDATPYLERNRVGRDAIDSAAALTDMGKYLFRERRLPVYDIAVAITKLDMCRRQYANDACNRGTAGFAYVGGACVVNKRLEKVNSVAIIEDTGGFSGIIVAAHEVGHLLGAVHDGSPPPSYLGGPGAEKCRWEDGYIMSDLRHTERGFRWSPCSVQSFHHFLNGDTASCLHNAPHEDEALGRQLPGTLLSLDAQCRRDRGTSACFKDERVCAQLFCFDAASGYCVAYRPAAEGSTCGDGQHCLDGRCVAEHENIIPDYSQHTPAYVSPNSFGSQFKNDNKKSSEDEEVTTQSTTPQQTTTSTTTVPSTLPPEKKPAPKSYFSNSYNHQNNNNHNNNPRKTTKSPFNFVNNFSTKQYPKTIKTVRTTTTTTTVAPSTRKTINPHYTGAKLVTSATNKPFVFSKYTFSTKGPYQWTSTRKADVHDEDQNNYENPPNEQEVVEPSSTPKAFTYNPVFDIYFRQIGSQKKTSKKPFGT